MQPVEGRPFLEEPVEPPKPSWFHKLASLLFILVCFEVGVFLIVFPWMDYWNNNSIAALGALGAPGLGERLFSRRLERYRPGQHLHFPRRGL